MNVLTRDELLEFIADLSGPIGPEIFSGFGSNLQDEISGNLSAPDRIKEEWAQEVNPIQALKSLFEIASNPPREAFLNNFIGRFKKEWEYELTDLLFLIGKRDSDSLVEQMRIHKDDKNARNIVRELEIWLSEVEK